MEQSVNIILSHTVVQCKVMYKLWLTMYELVILQILLQAAAVSDLISQISECTQFVQWVLKKPQLSYTITFLDLYIDKSYTAYVQHRQQCEAW